MKKLLLFVLVFALLAGYALMAMGSEDFDNPGSSTNDNSGSLARIYEKEYADNGIAYQLNQKGTEYSVVGIGNCKDDEIVILSTFQDKPVTAIAEKAFQKRTTLKSVSIPDSVISIGDKAFIECINLKSVAFPNNLEKIGEAAFASCKSLKSINLPISIVNIGNSAFNSCSNLKTVIWNVKSCMCGKEGQYSVALFQNCDNLTEIKFGTEVEIIPKYAFRHCNGIKSIEIPSNVTEIEAYSFSNSDYLENVIINNGVQRIAAFAFESCHSLKTVNVPKSVSFIGYHAFMYCHDLSRVTFEETSGWYIANAGDAGTDLSISVANPTQNAEYLRVTYENHGWFRE